MMKMNHEVLKDIREKHVIGQGTRGMSMGGSDVVKNEMRKVEVFIIKNVVDQIDVDH